MQSSGDTQAAETTGTATADTGDFPTTGAPPEGSDFAALAECQTVTVCDPYFHPHAEQEAYHEGDMPGLLDVEKCILSGLRDGLVGRYIFGTHYDGGTLNDFVIIVHADRQVTFAEHIIGVVVDENGVRREDSYEPAITCTLQDVGFFADCLENYDESTHYDLCMQGWWQACNGIGPRCE